MRAFKVRRNGQDYFRVDLPRNLFPDGKRRSVMAGTKREAIEKAKEISEKCKRGLNTEEAKAPLGEFLQRFLSFYKTEGGVALRTWQDYRYHIDENIAPVIGLIPLSDLKPREVDLWLKSLRERGLGNRSVEYAQAVLRRALQFAVEWEILDRNPAAARFRAAKRKKLANQSANRIQFLNPNQARLFLDVIRENRHEVMYALGITTGLRPEELYGLRWTDLNLEACKLTVNQVLSKTRRKKGEEGPRFLFGPPKTEKSRRTIDFPEFVQSLLAEERRLAVEDCAIAGKKWHESNLVFPSEAGTPLEERNVLRRLQAVCAANELPKLRVYDLRHTHASLLIHQGVHPKKISERLGHSSIKLTMDIYGHLFEGSDRDSAEKMEQLLAPENVHSGSVQGRRPDLRVVPKKAS